ncbi:hypothetical protein BJX64DRAFT_269960 [Aspergillus heterothallicus]
MAYFSRRCWNFSAALPLDRKYVCCAHLFFFFTEGSNERSAKGEGSSGGLRQHWPWMMNGRFCFNLLSVALWCCAWGPKTPLRLPFAQPELGAWVLIRS